MEQEECLEKQVRKALLSHYGLNVITHRRLDSFIDVNFYLTAELQNTNPHIESHNGHGYVAKIVRETHKIGQQEKSRLNIFEAQEQLMLHVLDKGICVPKPIQTVDGQLNCHLSSENDADAMILLYSFIPGTVLSEIDVRNNRKLMIEYGQLAGKLDKVMMSFESDKMQNTCIYRGVGDVLSHIHTLDDEPKKDLTKKIVTVFQENVLGKLDELQSGIIHYDCNPMNFLARQAENGDWKMAAVLDFGDSCHSFYVFEVAIAIAQSLMCWKSVDAMFIRQNILNGYIMEIPLSDREMEVLDLCVVVRLLQAYIYSNLKLLEDPNNKYVLNFMHWDRIMEISSKIGLLK